MVDDSIDGKCADGNDMQLSYEFSRAIFKAAANYVKGEPRATRVDPASIPVKPWYRRDDYLGGQ